MRHKKLSKIWMDTVSRAAECEWRYPQGNPEGEVEVVDEVGAEEVEEG